MSGSERENVHGSPIPTKINPNLTNEETRLLDTSTKSYGENGQTIITMSNPSSSIEGLGPTDLLSGHPTLPEDQLTEKIQDILVFSEIKKNQGRKLAQQKDPINKNGSSSSINSSSSSDSDSNTHESRHVLRKKLSEWSIDHGPKSSKRLRKRDMAIDALRLATDRWKEKHGWFSSHHDSEPETEVNEQSKTHNSNKPAVVEKKQKAQRFQNLPSSAEIILGVAKNASVCAVLALLHERRQSSGHSTETDVFLQTLALSTLSLSLKSKDAPTRNIILKEMLVGKWLHGRSALEWAVENNSQIVLSDKRVQAVIEELWVSGPDWRQDSTHPSNIWKNSPQTGHHRRSFFWEVVSRTTADFFARWASPRYQALVGLISGLVYLGLHLATISNLDYISDTPFAFEYAYYVFVASDMLLELTKAVPHPIIYLKTPSSYLSFTTAGLLTSSAIIRFFALIVVEDIQEQSDLVAASFMTLILATPLMFFRLFSTNSASSLSWGIAKAKYVVTQCILNSLWVFGVSLIIIVGFWVSLGALQYDDISLFATLRLLVLGALHAPEIANTLLYQPAIAGVLLAFYLLAMVVFVGALLTASFLSTILEINTRTQEIKSNWAIQRSIQTKPGLNKFIPGVLLDVLFNLFQWISCFVFKTERATLNEKMHQVAWYIVYSPIILVVGAVDLIYILVFHWKIVSKAFEPNN